MTKRRAWPAVLAVVFIVGASYGIAMQRYGIFPFGLLKQVNTHWMKWTGRLDGWAIGIYEGPTPFDLEPAKGVTNPVLTGRDVTDIRAEFTADPFLVREEEAWYVFFEALNQETAQGDLAYARSADAREWTYGKVVVDEPFHLSFPYVFEWAGGYYMVPESHEDFSVRLYRASSFPEEWEYAGNLLSGYAYTDPSIFRHDDKWWLFVSTTDDNVLNLYWSDSLQTGWAPHPMNPIVKGDRRYARSGGRVFEYDGELYRVAQDDEETYGTRVWAFRITDLTTTTYADSLIADKPLIGGTGTGWNAMRMHQVDMVQTDDRWIAVVDGMSN